MSKRPAESAALALVVFLLLFVGVGAITTLFIFPMFAIAPVSIEGMILWGVLVFAAVFAFAKYSHKSAVPT